MAKAAKTCATCGAEYQRDALFCPSDGTPLGSSHSNPGEDPYLGSLIAGQIELRQLIGIGSMGRVYRAFQRGIERDVAVKMLHRELSANATLVNRFLREARIASRLTHPNVVQVLMSGQLPEGAVDSSTGSELYIVMEYLDGISLLSALAASDGSMPLPRALHVTLQICDAVGEAHAQGIVHRDLKPENVMLVRRGDDPDFVKVLDFGIARFSWGEESVTQAGLIFGTARYISPEGSQGEPVGPQADVYAIATLLYQCLSGRTPFESESPVALLMQHAHELPPDLPSIPRASYVPGPIASAIMRNLSKRPDDRSPDARIFGRELVEAAKAGGIAADELVVRSTLLGQRSRSSVAFTSIERTKELELSGDVKVQIAAHGSVPDGRTSNNPPDTHAHTVELGPLPGINSLPAVCSPAPVDITPSVRVSRPGMVSAVGSNRQHTPIREVESTLDDDDVPPSRSRRHRMGVGLFVVACFLAGAGAAALGAYRMGYIGRHARLSASDYVLRGNEAIRAHRWDSPPLDNVREITDEGLRMFPNDPGLLDVRARAAEELVSTALGRKYGADLQGALALAALAKALNPANTTAQHLVVELESLRADAASSRPSTTSSGAPEPLRLSRPNTARPIASSSSKSPPPLPPPTQSTATAQAAPPPTPSNTSGRWL